MLKRLGIILCCLFALAAPSGIGAAVTTSTIYSEPSTLMNGLLDYWNFLGSPQGSSDVAGANNGSDTAMSYSYASQTNLLAFVDSTGSGTFTITVNGSSTAAITYSSTVATLVSNINSALNTAFGTSNIVASGGSLATVELSLSGGSYAGKQWLVKSTMLTGSAGYTINGLGLLNQPTVSPNIGLATNGVASFNGTSSYVATNTALPAGSFTVAVWFKPVDDSNTYILLAKDSGGSERALDLQYGNGPGYVTANVWNTGGSTNSNFAESTAPTIGNWNLAVLEWNTSSSTVNGLAANTVALYVNNILQGTESLSGTPLQSTDTFNFGRRDYSGSAEFFNGSESEIGFWGRILTTSELSNIWNGGNGQTMPFQISSGIPIISVGAIGYGSGSNIGTIETYEASGSLNGYHLGSGQCNYGTQFIARYGDGVHLLVCNQNGTLDDYNTRTQQKVWETSGLVSSSHTTTSSVGYGPIMAAIDTNATTGTNPYGVAYVASWLANTVWKINLATGQVIWTCALGADAHSVAWGMTTIFLSNDGSPGTPATKVAVNQAYATSYAGFATINTTTGVATEYAPSSSVTGGASSRSGCFAAFFSQDNNYINVTYNGTYMDVYTNASSPVFQGSKSYDGQGYVGAYTAQNPAIMWMPNYGGNPQGEVTRWNVTTTSSPTVSGTISIGGNAQTSDGYFSDDGTQFWATDYANATTNSAVTEIAVGTNSITENIPNNSLNGVAQGGLWGPCGVRYFPAIAPRSSVGIINNGD